MQLWKPVSNHDSFNQLSIEGVEEEYIRGDKSRDQPHTNEGENFI